MLKINSRSDFVTPMQMSLPNLVRFEGSIDN
jgi:hypothetical protein